MSAPRNLFFSHCQSAVSWAPRRVSRVRKALNTDLRNEWMSWVCKERCIHQVPLTSSFCFLIISAHLLPAFRQGKRCISTFLSVFQMQATLTSVLFQLVYKNKYPARNCVQNSPRCQNKFIPFNISRATANPRWPSGYLLPKCTIAQLKSTLTTSSWAHHIHVI